LNVRHLIASRFSVPRLDPASASRHADPEWLETRLRLFRRFFVPSVAKLEVPVVLLCSSASAERVAAAVRDLDWAMVQVQDSWYGGLTASPEQWITRLDSDDALRQDWFRALDEAPPGFDVYCTRDFLRLDLARGRLFAYRRREPCSLAAFRGDLNPFAHDHAQIARHYRSHEIPGAYLLQVVHGGNLSSRKPGWWRLPRRVPLERRREFGLP
jgi:hypothetical protein